MGKNYGADAERRTVDVWICKTCGRYWLVKSRDKTWTEANAEEAARMCCSENSPCRTCGEPAKRPYAECEGCRQKRQRERWEKCEVKPLEFPLTIQDGDERFVDADELLEYCDENEVTPGDLLLRISERVTPYLFDPNDFWCDYYADDDHNPTDDSECVDLADKLDEWATENIILHEEGPCRPDVSELEKSK